MIETIAQAAVAYHARGFLPLLKKSDEAWLVNISSLFGLIAPPGDAASHELTGTPHRRYCSASGRGRYLDPTAAG